MCNNEEKMALAEGIFSRKKLKFSPFSPRNIKMLKSLVSKRNYWLVESNGFLLVNKQTKFVTLPAGQVVRIAQTSEKP